MKILDKIIETATSAPIEHVITFVGGAIVTVAVVWIKTRGAKPVARALATGYFYSFVNRIGAKVRDSNLEVIFDPSIETWIDPAKKGKYVFQKGEVKIEFYLPKHFSAQTKANTTATATAGTNKADVVLSPTENRNIRYYIDNSGRSPILVIKDEARTFLTIEHYATDQLEWNYTNPKHVGRWKKLEQTTLKVFQKKLYDLLDEVNKKQPEDKKVFGDGFRKWIEIS